VTTDGGLPEADLRSAAVRGLRSTVIARPIVEFVLFGTLIALARLVPPADFGRYAVALVFGELMLIPGQAVGVALVQRSSAGPDYMQTGAALSLLIGVAIVVISLIAAKFLIVPIYGERTANLVRLTCLGVMVNSTNIVPSAILQRRLAFRRLTVVQVVGTGVGAFASVGLAVALRSATAMVFGGLVGALAGTALFFAWARPPLPRLHLGPARDLAGYGLPAALAATSWVGFRNCDYAIVGARLGALQAGFYFRAYTLGVEYQKKVSQVMGSVGFPLLARARSTADQHQLRRRMVRLLTLVLFPALVLLAITAPVLIPRLFGSQWAAAVVPTQILAIGGAATLVIDAIGAALMAAGRARAMLGYGWGHFVSYGLTVLLVSPLGIVAVAVAAATIHSLFAIIAYILLVRRERQPPLQQLLAACREFWGDVKPAVVSCLALACVAVPLSLALSSAEISAVLELMAVGVVGVTTYVVALRILYPESFHSLGLVLSHLLPKGVSQRLAGWALPRLAA
jgi:lipopolysaccharide exporter